MDGWIGVDLDGTLAIYDKWQGPEHIGDPIPLMVQRIRDWVADGREVRIMTARVSGRSDEEVELAVKTISDWCREHIGYVLPITCQKDYAMIELWDDRVIQVIPNTGRTIADELESVKSALAGKAAHG